MEPSVASADEIPKDNSDKNRLRFLNELKKLMNEKNTLESMRAEIKEQLRKLQHEQRYATDLLNCINRIPNLQKSSDTAQDDHVDFIHLDEPLI